MRALLRKNERGKVKVAEGGARGIPWWLWPNVLSLDAPVVAVVWLWAMGRTWGDPVPWLVLSLLAAAVWCIYTADRLLDGRRLRPEVPHSRRHAFSRKWSRELTGVVGVLAAGGGLLALWQIPQDRWLGLGTPLAGVVLYLACLRRAFWFPKEVSGGVLFALGTVAYLIGGGAVEWKVVVLFAALCSANCLCIARWERDWDAHQDPAASGVQRDWLLGTPLVAGLLVLVGLGSWGWMGGDSLEAGVALGAGGLLALRGSERWLSIPVRRVVADGVLLGPLLTLCW
ncbi:MAG: hypothetical protein AAGJ31_00925 [Verrucomicrobiota bacterium]